MADEIINEFIKAILEATDVEAKKIENMSHADLIKEVA